VNRRLIIRTAFPISETRGFIDVAPADFAGVFAYRRRLPAYRRSDVANDMPPRDSGKAVDSISTEDAT
jgi:hypothetical protein